VIGRHEDGIRVGVRLDHGPLPAWIAEALRRIQSLDGVVVEWATSVDSPVRLTVRGLLLRAYTRLDRGIFGLGPDPEEPVPLLDVIGPAVRAEDANAVDLVLDFASERRPYVSAAAAGVWRVEVDAGSASRPDAYYRSLRRSRAVCAVAIRAALPDGTELIVAQSHSAVDRVSIARTRDPILWKIAAIVPRSVARFAHDRTLAADGVRESVSPDEVHEPATPGLAQLAFWCLRVAGRVARRRARKAIGRDDWFLAFRPAASVPDAAAPMAEALRAGPPFRPLGNPRGGYRADPFLLEREGRQFLFFEEYRYAEQKGHIAVAELNRTGYVTTPVPCLVRDYHISYPFVFEHLDDIWMLPEAVGNRAIELYRATVFPRLWELERKLMEDVMAVDPTLFRHNGLWWLFANLFDVGTSPNDELFLFFAPTLHDAWTPHPGNPIVSDVRCARPAGRLFRSGTDLVRPAQDGSGGYGSSIALRRVVTLSTTEYREVDAGTLPSSWVPKASATHTYDRSRLLEVTDAQGLRLRAPIPARRR
jgi:hypothetical protein